MQINSCWGIKGGVWWQHCTQLSLGTAHAPCKAWNHSAVWEILGKNERQNFFDLTGKGNLLRSLQINKNNYEENDNCFTMTSPCISNRLIGINLDWQAKQIHAWYTNNSRNMKLFVYSPTHFTVKFLLTYCPRANVPEATYRHMFSYDHKVCVL